MSNSGSSFITYYILFCWWCFPLTVIEILSVCLRRPCVRFAICMTVHRSKCHLVTVRLPRYGLLSYACVYTHLSTWKYLRQIAWIEKCTIWNEELQKFSGKGALPSPQTLPHQGGGYPLPGSPLGASTLVPSMGNCHGCPQILETPLVKSSPRRLTVSSGTSQQ